MTGGLAGIFSTESRQQYGAVAAMRGQMLRHSLRSKRGNFELGARIFTIAFFSVIALAIGTGLGFGAYSIASGHTLRLLVVLFWPVLFLWQFLPLMVASFQEHVDLSAFLRFPMSFAAYMLVTLVFGLLDISTIMGSICLYGIWIGLVVAQPHAVLGITAALLLFAIFNILLTRTIFAWIDRWLAQRRTREIMGAAFLFLLLSVQLINPLMQHYQGRSFPIGQKTLQEIDEAQSILPPGLTASAVRYAIRNHQPQSLSSLGGLVLYGGATALLFGFRLHAEYRGESLGEGSRQSTRARKSTKKQRAGALDLGPVGAVIEKELRYLSRSGIMLYSLAAPLFMLLIFSGGGMHRGSGLFLRGQYALPAGVAYSFLGLTRMIYNSLGGEGAGIQLYFLSPTPFRTIMLSKNLMQAGLFCMELLSVCLIVFFRYGMPEGGIIAATFCWLLFALPLQLASGNIVSLTVAYRMTLTRMSREEGAAGNGFLSLGIQVAIVGIGVAVFLPLSRYHHTGLAAGIFLMLAVASAAFWLRIFKAIDRMAANARENLIQTLARAA